MSFGKMQTVIEIYSANTTKDSEGFVTQENQLLIKTRAYKEDRNGSEAWKNRASFSSATSLFRFRKIFQIDITTDLMIICNDDKYNILSVQDIMERGMYVEILAERIMSSKG